MTSDDDSRDTPMDRLRQEYAENELDHDRNPTEDGFVEWLARRVAATRPTPHLDAVKAERDAALARAEDHRRAAHEAAGQLDALRRDRDLYRDAVLHVLGLAPVEYRQRIVAARGAGPGADTDYWRWCGQAEAIRQTIDALASRAGFDAPDWEQIKRGVPADGIYRGADQG
jgi:hypothetical protein